MTAEAPVHRRCADYALTVCPHLKRINGAKSLAKFPGGYVVMAAIVGGALCEEDYQIKIGDRRVVGHLKLAWPQSEIPRLGVIGVSVTEA